MKWKGTTEASFFYQPVNTNLSLFLSPKGCCTQNLKHHPGSLSSCEKIAFIVSSKKSVRLYLKTA